MNQETLRNIAIIAHVDHGKTTLVDELFKQSGLFRENQVVEERMMDSMDLERERGITIKSKNGAFAYKDHTFNIIDTPGHADFGGEVERVLSMADGALFLVDAAEGPMPQSYFVLKKALERGLHIIVVINKIDKPAARCGWVVDQVIDLFVRLEAPDDCLDFPIVYTSAKEGTSTLDLAIPGTDMVPLLDEVINFIPHPKGDPNESLQVLVSAISYSPFLGRLAVGKVTSGTLKMNQDVWVATGTDQGRKGRITKLYRFEGNQHVDTNSVSIGQIVALAGIDDIKVGQTVTDIENPIPLDFHDVDPPTLSVNFLPNDSPFSGQEGEYVTSNHIKERLDREILSDVALVVEPLSHRPGFKVSGRGELHLCILIEKMRREGYEFQVSRPSVVLKKEDGKTLEPYETLTIEVAEDMMGRVIEKCGERKGQLVDMQQDKGMAKLNYTIPTRGILGYFAEFMMDTKGKGVLSCVFSHYGDYSGDIPSRKNGVMVAKEPCNTVSYALFNLQERGVLFMGPGVSIYEGQIIGEHCRDNDLIVNPGKGKKLTNVRASGSDDAIILTPHTIMSLDACLSFITQDELIEVTPKSIRLRKVLLSESERKRAKVL